MIPLRVTVKNYHSIMSIMQCIAEKLSHEYELHFGLRYTYTCDITSDIGFVLSMCAGFIFNDLSAIDIMHEDHSIFVHEHNILMTYRIIDNEMYCRLYVNMPYKLAQLLSDLWIMRNLIFIEIDIYNKYGKYIRTIDIEHAFIPHELINMTSL